MKIKVFPGGFRVYPDHHVESEASPLMGYCFVLFVVTVFCVIATSFPVVSRLNSGGLAYETCTLDRFSVFDDARGLKEHQVKIRFITPDCGTYTYQGFDYNLSGEELEEKLESYQGQAIEFSSQQYRILPTRDRKTYQFAVGVLDWRTWDISQLKK